MLAQNKELFKWSHLKTKNIKTQINKTDFLFKYIDFVH